MYVQQICSARVLGIIINFLHS